MTLPRLAWAGRAEAPPPEDATLPPPSELSGPADTSNLLIHQDNLRTLAALARTRAGTVDLIYADPPFATGLDFTHRATTGDTRHATPGFTDAFPGGLSGWLDVMLPRLRLMHTLLAETGSLYLHLDATTVHYARVLLDEIFGPACFQRQIVWRIGWISGFKSSARNWIRNHDTLLYYVKTPGRATFNKAFLPHAPGYLRRDGKPPKGRGIPLDDVWNAQPGDTLDSIQIKSFSREKTGYPTQKNEALLARIVGASSRPGDLVADFFGGAGTTAVVAHRLGRRFLTVDLGASAVALTRKRLVAAGAAFRLHAEAASEPSPHRLAREDGHISLHAAPARPPLDQLATGHTDASGVFHATHHHLRGRTAPGLDALRLPAGNTPATVQLIDVEGRVWRSSV